ncbi:MAG: hypothetical protein JO340_01695 [Acidobacteriaceae bacterium]|nr:hypothetical protein [Acidobacteriaceae bacterium]
MLSYFAICGISGRTFSTLSCVFGLTLYQSVVIQPNLTEVECLPFQAISFLLLLTDLRFGVSVRRAFCQGILCGLLFWTRPNAIGITFVYVLAVAILTLRKPCITLLWRCGLACLAGICLSTGIIIAPVLKHASWSELWFATFQFNHAYAGLVGPAEHIHALYWMVQYTAQHGVIIFALAGCLLVFIRRPALDSVKNQAFLLTAIWLVVEALAAAYSGKLYGKNATLWILPSMCGIAFLFSNLVPISTSRNVKASLASLSVVASFFVLSDTLKEYRQNSKEELAQSDVVREIRRLSSSGDEVFFWGDFPTDVILRAGRPSGSRIFNSIPMMHGLSTYRPLAKIALQDLARTLPKLVVERCDSALPPLFANDPPNAPAQARWETNELQTEKKVLSGNYAPAWRNTPGTVVIFERVKESASFISAKPSRT